jgi:hypothetical protein
MQVMRVIASMSVVVWSGAAAAQPCIRGRTTPMLVSLDGDAVKFCFDLGDSVACYREALADGALSTWTAPSKPAEQPTSLKLDGSKVTLGKTTIATKLPQSPDKPLQAAANAAGTLLAVWDSAGTKKTIETYDVATGSRLASFHAGSTDEACVGVSFLGDTLMIDESNCAGPDDTAWLATKAGKRLAMVGGGKGIPTFEITPARVKDSVWAFNSAGGDEVALQDVGSGKVVKKIKLGDNRGILTNAMVGDDKRLVVVLGDDNAGDVAAIDLATDKVTRQSPAKCP